MIQRRQLMAAALGAAAMGGAAVAQTTDADALSRARAIGNRARSVRRFYDRSFDLSGLPPYEPARQVSGVIRQWGDNYLKDSGLMAVWEAEFRKHHPRISFSDNLVSSAVAFPGLISGAADLAPLGRQALWDELKGFEREGAEGGEAGVGNTQLVEVVFSSGSYNVRGWTFALGVYVHRDNPLTQLSLDQLDGVFGAERDGGWDGLTWRTDWARGPERNIRSWGQLGLGGRWADKPISLYGYNAKYHFADEIDKKLLRGSSKWNERLHAFSNMAGLKADRSLTPAGDLIIAALSKDPYGMAYAGDPFRTEMVRSLALAPRGGGPAVPLNIDTVQQRSYPLQRDVYYYLRRESGRPLEPKSVEFLRYILSRDGQAALQADGKYLPLTAEAARAQLAKLA